MKFDEFTTVVLDKGRVQVMFTEPVTNDWELSLFMDYFRKHKKKIYVDYIIKPKVSIKGLVCHQKTWDAFLRHIQRSAIAEMFEEAVRDFKNIDEMEEYLKELQAAGIREREKILKENKLIRKKKKKT
jgi:hypothetical protein